MFDAFYEMWDNGTHNSHQVTVYWHWANQSFNFTLLSRVSRRAEIFLFFFFNIGLLWLRFGPTKSHVLPFGGWHAIAERRNRRVSVCVCVCVCVLNITGFPSLGEFLCVTYIWKGAECSCYFSSDPPSQLDVLVSTAVRHAPRVVEMECFLIVTSM